MNLKIQCLKYENYSLESMQNIVLFNIVMRKKTALSIVLPTQLLLFCASFLNTPAATQLYKGLYSPKRFLGFNAINFELNGFNAIHMGPLESLRSQKLWCTNRNIQTPMIYVKKVACLHLFSRTIYFEVCEPFRRS